MAKVMYCDHRASRKVLWVFIRHFFFVPESALETPMSNFALAGNEVVCLGVNYLWGVDLANAFVIGMD